MEQNFNKSYYKHSICLVSIFIIGNILTVLPEKGKAEYSILGLFAGGLASIAFYYIYSVIQKFDKAEIFSGFFKKPLGIACAISFIIFCIICLSKCADDYINYIDETRLPNTSRLIIAIIFLSLAVIIAKCKKNVIFLFAIISMIIITITILAMFIFSIPNIRFSYIINCFKPELNGTLKQTTSIFINSFGQGIIPVIFMGYNPKRNSTKVHLLGLLCGFLIILVCLLNIFLVFGSNITNQLSYPYSVAMSLISFGSSFSRLEGFTYYIYLICSIIKASIIIAVILKLTNNMPRAISCITKIISTLFVIYFTIYAKNAYVLSSNIVSIFLLAFEIIVPVILLIIYLKIKE